MEMKGDWKMADSIRFDVTGDGDLELVIPTQIWELLKAAAASGEPPEEADGSIRIRFGHGDLSIESIPPEGNAPGVEAIPPTLQPGCQALIRVIEQ
jgi:hypothetical protein